MTLEEGDIVMCTVDRIAGTIVFVKIDGEGEGSIILSEIAPGRIRNLRDYVIPKKRIICKILRIRGDRINLSLRRVTPKEQKEVLEKYKQEKSYASVLKSILGEKAKGIKEKILQQEKISDFLEEAKEKPARLEKLVGKPNAKKIIEILNTQKQKIAILKKQISLTTKEPEGLTKIKNILGKSKAEIKYVSAGKYAIKIEEENMKKADAKMKEIISGIENNAKKEGLEFSVK